MLKLINALGVITIVMTLWSIGYAGAFELGQFLSDFWFREVF